MILPSLLRTRGGKNGVKRKREMERKDEGSGTECLKKNIGYAELWSFGEARVL